MLVQPIPARPAPHKHLKHPLLTNDQIYQAQQLADGDHPCPTPYTSSYAGSPYTPVFPGDVELGSQAGLYAGQYHLACDTPSSATSTPATSAASAEMLNSAMTSGFHHPALMTSMVMPTSVSASVPLPSVTAHTMPTNGDFHGQGHKMPSGGPQSFLSTMPPSEYSTPSPASSCMDGHPHGAPGNGGPHMMFGHPAAGMLPMPYGGPMVPSHSPHGLPTSDPNGGPYGPCDPRMEHFMGYPQTFDFSCELQPPMMGPSLSFSSEYSASSRDYDGVEYHQVSPNMLPNGMFPDYATVPNGGGRPGNPSASAPTAAATAAAVAAAAAAGTNAPAGGAATDRPRRKRGNPRGRRAPTDKATKKSASKEPKEKRFQCNYEGCGDRFNRAEHVYRHIRSVHLKSRPYSCPEPGCTKKFSRTDNLTQHRRTHDKPKSKAKDREFHNSFVNTMMGDEPPSKRRNVTQQQHQQQQQQQIVVAAAQTARFAPSAL